MPRNWRRPQDGRDAVARDAAEANIQERDGDATKQERHSAKQQRGDAQARVDAAKQESNSGRNKLMHEKNLKRKPEQFWPKKN